MNITSHSRRCRLAVVFLARGAEGIDALRRFQTSYANHDAGVDHDLVVVFKGFSSADDLANARSVFAEQSIIALEIDDLGFDINAYYKASVALDHEYLCFLNTHSEVVADNWLEALLYHGTRSEVGIASATGSYESLQTSLLFVHEVRSLWHSGRVRDIEGYRRFFDMYLDSPQFPSSRFSHYRARLCSKPMFYQLWRLYLQCRFGKSFVGHDERFPSFPNPHIRSNAFLIRRDRFLSRTDAASIRTKWDAYAFESGSDGLTATLARSGLRAIVVGRDARGYELDEWPSSKTFRSDEQSNLLVSDNQTRRFAGLSTGLRTTVERMTWGDYLGQAPPDFGVFSGEFAKEMNRIRKLCA